MAKQTRKETKVITRRKKFINVEIPLTKTKIELIGNSPEDLKGHTIKLDLTRQLKGKSIEATVEIKIKDDKAIAYPKKIKLMPYFIRRMIRKRISYVEDSIETPSQENMIRIKPFLITRKRVSRAVRKALRNRCKNWIEDYIAERTNEEIFNEILSNRMQKPLSLVLKKTYPLSLCEVRILEVKRPLKPEEVPKIEKKLKSDETKIKEAKKETIIEKGLDQLAEIEQAKKQAEEEIKKTQEKAVKIEDSESKEEEKEPKEDKKEAKPKKEVKKEEKKKDD